MTRWFNRALLLAVVVILAIYAASALDLWHRQQNFDNCQRQAQAIEGLQVGGRWLPDDRYRYARQVDTCEYYRQQVENWPRK